MGGGRGIGHDKGIRLPNSYPIAWAQRDTSAYLPASAGGPRQTANSRYTRSLPNRQRPSVGHTWHIQEELHGGIGDAGRQQDVAQRRQRRQVCNAVVAQPPAALQVERRQMRRGGCQRCQALICREVAQGEERW